MNEKNVFFAICKAVRAIQNNYGGNCKTIRVDFANVNIFLKESNAKKVYAICYKLQEMGLIDVVKDGYCTVTFMISDKGINYINTLKAR